VQNGNGIGKKYENIPADNSIKRFVGWNLGYVALREGYVVKASLRNSVPRPTN
jgi:hypothetical protein